MTAEDARPWWASADPEVDGLDPHEDPIEVLRAARRGPENGADAATDAAGDDGAATGAADDDGAARAAEDHAAACSACPLCTGWRLLQEHHPDVATHLAAAGRHLAEAQPEVAEHLSAAGRHLAAALRHLLDDPGPDAGESPDEGPEPRRRRGGRDAPFERIVLDDQEDPQ